MREVYSPNLTQIDVSAATSLALPHLSEPVQISLPRDVGFHVHGRWFLAHEASIATVAGEPLTSPIQVRFLSELDFRVLKSLSDLPLERDINMFFDREHNKAFVAVAGSRGQTAENGFGLSRGEILQVSAFVATELRRLQPSLSAVIALEASFDLWKPHCGFVAGDEERHFALRCFASMQGLPADAYLGAISSELEISPLASLSLPQVESALDRRLGNRVVGSRLIEHPDDARRTPNRAYLQWLSHNSRITSSFRSIDPPQTREVQRALYEDLFLDGSARPALREFMISAAPVRIPDRAKFYNEPRVMRSGYLEATLHWFAETLITEDWQVWYKARFHTNPSQKESAPPSMVVSRDIGPNARQMLLRPTQELRSIFSQSRDSDFLHLDASGNLWIDASRWEQARKPEGSAARSPLDTSILWAGHWPYVREQLG